ncbi:cytochrome c [Panacibacter sp. DH6]|uniref:Cytochrome c n=1 Tax=Panacibacter microcysteis TaxID=2793269 RepID=A0A931E4S8_9BACT|nr:cytochrome c [Panacibacter microcysteis]MBG9375275.1 cytochrome c [Panacibacter microcysteis]
MQKTSFVFFVLASVIWFACKGNSQHEAEKPAAAVTDLNAFQTVMPQAPGYNSFQANCMSCHSGRYVQMQPALPEKTWAAIVTKMQKTFGAPISDSAAKEIVQYLVAVKGK